MYSPNQKLKHLNNREMILEHIYVMCTKLGRNLLPNKNIHHINGKQRFKDKIEFNKYFLIHYCYTV